MPGWLASWLPAVCLGANANANANVKANANANDDDDDDDARRFLTVRQGRFREEYRYSMKPFVVQKAIMSQPADGPALAAGSEMITGCMYGV